jgi:hypothetical protein
LYYKNPHSLIPKTIQRFKMANKILLGFTKLDELAEFFGYENEQLESKRARLFPVGNTTEENQTTSIFLSSLSAVKEYREELLSAIGITKIKNRNVSIHVFTEIYNDEKSERPDGLIVLTSGKNNPVIEWISFVEVKVKNNQLTVEQIEHYIDFARNIGIDSIITISNKITTLPTESPIETKKAKGFNLYHWSWTYLKVISKYLLRTNKVSDDDHVYILRELRYYLDNHKNISNFTNMGSEWRDAVQSIYETDRSKKLVVKDINSVVSAYKEEEMDIALQLTDNTKYFVHLLTKNSENRSDTLFAELNESRRMTSSYYINENKKHFFSVMVDLAGKYITCQCTVYVSNGKAQAQTSAILKLLEPAATENIKVRAVYHHNKSEKEQLLTTLYEEKKKQKPYSIINKEMGDEIKYFELTMRKELGRDMTGNKNFIENIEGLCETFLLQVVRYVFLGEK